MSSQRFPGKVLAPFRGQPLIRQVLASIEHAVPWVPIVVATSVEGTDDPLASYLQSIGVAVFRGPLDNVFERFRKCTAEYPCDWILRVSADSPLLDARVIRSVVNYAGSACDLVSTVFPRTFPKGHNAELIRVSTLMKIDVMELSPAEREHVTLFFYKHPNRFQIISVESGKPELAQSSVAVDSVEDLCRLERLTESDLRRFSYNLPPSRRDS